MRKESVFLILILISLVLVFVVFTEYVGLRRLFDSEYIPTIGSYRILSAEDIRIDGVVEPEDLIIARDITAKQLKENDVVAYLSLDEALHNDVQMGIVESVSSEDAVLLYDAEGDIDSSEIIGVCKYKLTGIGHIYRFLSQPLISLIILLTAGGTAIVMLSRRQKKMEQKKAAARKSMEIKMRIKSAL